MFPPYWGADEKHGPLLTDTVENISEIWHFWGISEFTIRSWPHKAAFPKENTIPLTSEYIEKSMGSSFQVVQPRHPFTTSAGIESILEAL